MNIVTGRNTIKDLIIHFLLLRQGEHPLYPELGLPDLIFRPIKEVGETAFAELIRRAILELNQRYDWGLSRVETHVGPDVDDTTISRLTSQERKATFFVTIYLFFAGEEEKDFLQVDYQTLARDTEDLIVG